MTAIEDVRFGSRLIVEAPRFVASNGPRWCGMIRCQTLRAVRSNVTIAQMTGRVPEKEPEPRDVAADETTDGHDAERIESQEQQPEPESIEAPDAG